MISRASRWGTERGRGIPGILSEERVQASRSIPRVLKPPSVSLPLLPLMTRIENTQPV
jgi:hypothetical protein